MSAEVRPSNLSPIGYFFCVEVLAYLDRIVFFWIFCPLYSLHVKCVTVVQYISVGLSVRSLKEQNTGKFTHI
jgi:hypothetical protein